ncbi:MAG: ThiF family adenylyltransferase [Candidatus Aenigmarchaeota archaeon]|nr:ThiF family adenylyltransferase [Candidatus Aenigmarchaeota archaeon]
MEFNRYSRQILAFGQEGQNKIESANVAVVGLGGIGSQIVQALAHLGVGSFVLIDDDFVDISNLNRLIGATSQDAEEKTLKTVVSERQIRNINPKAKVQPILKNLRSADAIKALIECPIIFGCVDHDGPRLVLMELASAYKRILIDSATEIIPEGDKITSFDGRVVISRDGDYCLDCAQQIDMDRAKWELESPETRESRRAHGYGLPDITNAPAVISLNGVIANLAVTEFLVLVTGLREPNHHLTYYGLRGNVNIRINKRKDDCFTCGYLYGQCEGANIFRYILPGI